MNDNESTVLPWYRHRWPWFLMAGPGIVVIAGIVTLWLAVRSNDGLVTDDYYKQGLAINQMTARDQAAARLGFQVELMIGENGREIRAMLQSQSVAALPETVIVRLMHPTRSGIDQAIPLRRQGGGVYVGLAERPLSGRWQVSLEDEKREWRLTGEWLPAKTPVLRLP